ncbi:hypothetical protein SSX86_000717 [Deinandra increscens subsp. villosa]|uniref:Late embryogenesis abundant protein LEA-2 subgroup domain-containing protein n=1 Tax=Deinandra increscens subsp. villosa TaxID=3103831 RepID=A0AAP0H8K8_9ASTR
MASSQMSLLLLALLTLTASTTAIPTIFDIINQFGFPSGILPDSVTSYSTSPADGDSFTFTVYLKNPCYVKYDYLVHFDSEISGTISAGKITQLKGLKAQNFWFWLTVDEIKVDGSSLQFTLGLISVKSDISLFVAIPTCKDKALAACDHSTKLISQLPLKAEEIETVE